MCCARFDSSTNVSAQTLSKICCLVTSLPPNRKLSYELSDLKVVALTDDTAIANYELAERTDENGKTNVSRRRQTDVLVRRGGRWQIFAEHGSEMPKRIEPVAAGMPNGWRLTPQGSNEANYRFTVDSQIKHGGAASAHQRDVRRQRRRLGIARAINPRGRISRQTGAADRLAENRSGEQCRFVDAR